MKLTMLEVFKSASGKICQDSDMYTATRNGRVYTGRVCRPFNGEPTISQNEVRIKFKEVMAKVCEILKKSPSDAEYKKYHDAYKANPGKYVTFRGYLAAKLWQEGV